MEPDQWATDDLALAAYLVYMDDKAHVGFKWDHDSCFVVFNRSDKLLSSTVTFMGGEALVDPVRYNATFARVRNGMKSSKSKTRA